MFGAGSVLDLGLASSVPVITGLGFLESFLKPQQLPQRTKELEGWEAVDNRRGKRSM